MAVRGRLLIPRGLGLLQESEIAVYLIGISAPVKAGYLGWGGRVLAFSGGGEGQL